MRLWCVEVNRTRSGTKAAENSADLWRSKLNKSVTDMENFEKEDDYEVVSKEEMAEARKRQKAMVDYLLGELAKRVVVFRYVKADSTVRTATGTRCPGLIPWLPKRETAKKGNRRRNPLLWSYWDLEARGWRAFYTDMVLTVDHFE